MTNTSSAATAATARSERTDAEAIALLQTLRKDITTALDAVVCKHPGFAFELGRFTYDSGGAFNCSLKGIMPGGTSRAVQLYERMAKFNYTNGKLPPLGTTFTSKGVVHKITGATKRGRIITEGDGKPGWTWPVNLVFSHLTSGEQ